MTGYRKNVWKEPWWSNWAAMVQRMTNPNQPAYQVYVVEKGLDIDEEFVNDPWAFYKDIGEFPGKGYTIDRIDNTKGYVRGNLRWATRQTQALNKGVYKNNISGVSGITWDKNTQMWDVRIYRYGKTIFVGRYPDLEEAKVAKAERLLTYAI